ncbi:MAG: CapA family protein [Bacilli bacterium]|nr:CapA family protein [Bacilli bacterium]MBP3921294.1 CapA family protein [Bacilli bacterium]
MKWLKISQYSIIAIIIITFIYCYTNINKEEKIDPPKPSYQPIEKTKKQVELTITGDFLYEEPYYEALRQGEDINQYFSKVKKYFQNDLSIGNMEVVITDGTMELSGVGYSFCAPEFVAEQIKNLGMDVMSTANNHSNDRGQAGRISTINHLKNNFKILPVGTYNETRDITKNIITKNDIKFGFLSYTYGTNEYVPYELRYSLGLYRNPDTNTITEEYKEQIKNEVNKLKEMTDCVIVMIHWGNEFTFIPNQEQETLAQYLNSLGVDIIIGNHSHSIQPIKWIGNEHKTLVYYSLGNFVSADHIVDRTGETFTNAYQFGIISKITITKEENKIIIDNIKTEPIIDYYNANLRNFILIPYKEYTKDYETTHYLYNNNFNRDFIKNTYETVIDEEFRKSIY